MALAYIERLDDERWRVTFYGQGLNGRLRRAYEVECQWAHVLVTLGLKTPAALPPNVRSEHA